MWKFVLFALLSVLWLAGCEVAPQGPVEVPGMTQLPEGRSMIIDPGSAREVGLAYIRTYHPGAGPSKDAYWFEETVDTEAQAESCVCVYRYEDWVVTVSFPVVALDQTIYMVTVEDTSFKGDTASFYWEGQVDAYGQVVENTFNMVEALPTLPPKTATPVPPPIENSLSTATSQPTLTSSPTDTPTPTTTGTATPTGTATTGPCNAVEFVEDVTIQDGTTFGTDANFTKTWRLKNVGSCTWTSDYDLVLSEGNPMGADKFHDLNRPVRPGESVDLSVDMEAPSEPGDYQSQWLLRDDGGVLFGEGAGGDEPFWVNINVVEFDHRDSELDFALDYCSATWRSETGDLPCPGFIDSPDGFVNLLSNADIEDRREDEPTLWVHPNEARYGWIEGMYPSYKVEEDDHFRSWVGCMSGNERCDLTFYLEYMDIDGRVYHLGSWSEELDGNFSTIDIDLSDLEGERIRFILGVDANTVNVEDAHGAWFVPRVE